MNIRTSVVFLSVSLSSTLAFAIAPPVGTRMVMNCVDASNTTKPAEYVETVLNEWRTSTAVGGIDVYNGSRSKEYADEFFAGQMPANRAYVIQKPNVLAVFRSVDGKKACALISGEI